MANVLAKKKKTHPVEVAQLVEEMRDLIREKNLPVELVENPELKQTLGEVNFALAGCARCTLCPCMICW